MGHFEFLSFFHHRNLEHLLLCISLIAIGHKILCASYHIIKNKEAFEDLGYEYLIERKKKNRLEYLKRELKEHGYKIEAA